MEPCRTCRFAVVLLQQCRKNPPATFPVPTPNGIGMIGGFPGLPRDGAGCGAHQRVTGAAVKTRAEEIQELGKAIAEAEAKRAEEPNGGEAPRIVAP